VSAYCKYQFHIETLVYWDTRNAFAYVRRNNAKLQSNQMLSFENVGYHPSHEVTNEHPLLRAIMERGKILSLWHQGHAFLVVSCMKPRNCTVLNTFCTVFIAFALFYYATK